MAIRQEELELELEDELEFEGEWEGEWEDEQSLAAAGSVARGLLAEGEYEGEYEWEYEGEYEGESSSPIAAWPAGPRGVARVAGSPPDRSPPSGPARRDDLAGSSTMCARRKRVRVEGIPLCIR